MEFFGSGSLLHGGRPDQAIAFQDPVDSAFGDAETTIVGDPAGQFSGTFVRELMGQIEDGQCLLVGETIPNRPWQRLLVLQSYDAAVLEPCFPAVVGGAGNAQLPERLLDAQRAFVNQFQDFSFVVVGHPLIPFPRPRQN